MIAISSPVAGWVTPLDEVPDPVFAERMLGDGIAVDPVEGRVVAPGAGVVSSIHHAGHAVTLSIRLKDVSSHPVQESSARSIMRATP